MSTNGHAEMDSDLQKLGLDFARFVDLTDKQIVDLARATSMDLLQGLVKGTPVDTGWAKANWIPTLNTPNDSPRPKPEGQQPISNPEAQSMARSGAIKGMTIKDTVWIVNAVPYIVALAAGHSSKAPNGWMELVVEKLRIKLASLEIVRQ